MAGAGVDQSQDGAIDLTGRRLGHLLHQSLLIDYVGGTNPIYVGWAEPGTVSSAPAWRIAKITWDVNNNPTAVQWPSGSIAYSFVWDNRATLTYT